MREPETVYLVDDDMALREALAQRLQLAGYRVRTFNGPRQFLAKAALDAPGCVILDLRMPQMNGLELLRLMVARGASLPVIVLSGFSDRRTRKECLDLGAVDVVEKPISARHLISLIDTALGRDRAARFS
jgi:FixJ family two-component response regulator